MARNETVQLLEEVVEQLQGAARDFQRRADAISEIATELARKVGDQPSVPRRAGSRAESAQNGHRDEAKEEVETRVTQLRPLPEERSVGRFGPVTKEIVLEHAIKLGSFAADEIAVKLGLGIPATNRFLSELMTDKSLATDDGVVFECLIKPALRDWVCERKAPFTSGEAAEATGMEVEQVQQELGGWMTDKEVVRQLEDADLWEYIPPDPSLAPREHPHRAPPEKDRPSYTEAPVRGEPVRIRKDNRRQRSVAGAGGIKGVRQRNARFEKQQQAKEAAAEAKKAKAQKDPKFKSRSGKRTRTAA